VYVLPGWKFCVQSYFGQRTLKSKKPKRPKKTFKNLKLFLKNLVFFQPCLYGYTYLSQGWKMASKNLVFYVLKTLKKLQKSKI